LIPASPSGFDAALKLSQFLAYVSTPAAQLPFVRQPLLCFFCTPEGSFNALITLRLSLPLFLATRCALLRPASS
jgi:hypothetical protein